MSLQTWALGVACLLAACGGGSASTDRTDGPADDDGSADATPFDAPTIDATGADAPVCEVGSAAALTSCVEPARYQADLEQVAVERVPSSAAWQEVQDLCADRLAALGYTVERQDYGTGINVIGVKPGTIEPARRVLVAAHYDHIPGCTGADDNATGVAGTLEVARVLASTTYPRTLVVACWDEEERGLIGSRAYARRAADAGEQIDAYFNFEMIGYIDEAPNTQRLPQGFSLLFPDAAAEVAANDNRGNFISVIGDTRSAAAQAALGTHAARLGLPFLDMTVPDNLLLSPLTGDLRRSDHGSFWSEGFPGILITDTSEFRYDRYHCVNGSDSVAGLNRDFSANVVRMTVGAAATALGLD